MGVTGCGWEELRQGGKVPGRSVRARARRYAGLEPLELRQLLSSATITWGTQYQTIDGFGASSAWYLGNVDAAQQQLLWSTTNGGGLSILRSHINADTGASSGEIGTMQKAQAMGVTIFSTPWSPPAAWKSNNNIACIVNGVDTQAYLLASHYQDYANWLKQYIINMAGNGIPVYAVSMQNESNWSADYESCRWSAQQFYDVLPILHDTLASDSRTAQVKIMLPEEIHWNNLDLVSMVMSSTLNSYTNLIYADHTYGINTVNNSVYPGKDGYTPMSNLYPMNGHPIWETEHTGTDPAVGIQAALDEATSIYDIVYIAQAGAYCHWWIWPPNTTGLGGGSALVGGLWQWTKGFSGMASFSKFVRPGWVAIGETDDNNGLRIGAFKSTSSSDFALVVVNQGSSAITETFNLNGAYCPVITPWVTTATLDVAQQQSVPATGNGGSFSYTIPARSIVTFTGNATTSALTEAPTGLLANATSTTAITLNWTNNLAGATGYTVQRSANGTNWTTVSSSIAANTFTYTDTGLPSNTLYYYRVQANNGTLFSNVVTPMTLLAAPSNLTSSYNTSTGNVTLNWTGNGVSAADYAVDVSTDDGVTWVNQSSGISSSTYSFTDTLTPELATAVYRVRAIYGLNTSAPTNTVTVATNILKAPTGFTVTLSNTSAVLKWSDGTNTNATVSIERSTDGTTWAVVATVNHGVKTYTDNTLTEGNTYYYRIRNSYNSNYSAYATASAVTVAPAAPTRVEVMFAPLPTFMARVLWADNSSSETAYEVDRSADGGSTWTTLTNTLPPGSTTYTDTTASSGQAYRYRVKALNNTLTSTAVATLTETASPLPATFAHGDIGDASTLGMAGAALFNASNSTYSLTGAGADIWNTADGFQYAFTTLTGDGQMTTRIASLSATNSWAKAGLMIRDSLAPNAAFADVVITPGNGVSFQWRTTGGGSCSHAQTTGITAPVWLRLTRTGNVFRAYYSADNVTYTAIGGSTTLTLAGTSYAGMIVTAHETTQLATANFANFALTGTGNQAPTIQTPATANPSPVTGATTALSVLGADDAGQGNLVYTWNTSGAPPAAVIFSSNGQYASRNTVATFSAAGSYTFVATITDLFGLTTTSNVTLTVIQTASRIGVSPTGATVAPNSQRQFTATAYDQFGATFPIQPSFTWSTSKTTLGTINATSGLYSAGNLQGIATITATAGAASGSATVNVTSLPALVAWYRFDETSGSTAYDSSGNGRDATLTGSTAFGAGRSDNALALTGGRANLPGGIVSALTNFTVATWVKLDSIANWARLFDFGTGTTANMFLVPKNGSTNVIRFAITTGGGGGEQQINGTAALATGSWQHVAVTLSGNTGTLYVNGAAVGTNSNMTLRPSSLGTTTQNYLGDSQYSADPSLQGSIDDFRIYGTGLTAAQITQLYDSYLPPTVLTPAAASPGTITTTATALSVQGTSSANLALTYTWATIGTPPAPVTFSVNGTSAAKNTTATFSKAGAYTLGVTIADIYGQYTTSTVNVTVNLALTSIAVSPASASVVSGHTRQFTATAYDQFGAAWIPQPAFTWSLASGVGGINAGGLYTASFAAGSASVRATSGSVNGMASVTVTNSSPTVATPAAANPSPVTGDTTALSVVGADDGGDANLTYTWTLTGTPPAAVVYSVNGTAAAKNTTATFTKAGTYTFRVTITDGGGLTVTSSTAVTVYAAVAGRGIFYGGSAFDGATHDGAWAPDKAALLPGQKASFANYTSFDHGINGLALDVARVAGTLGADAFIIRVGNDDTPGGWVAGPVPTVNNRPGAGAGGSTRIELTWAEGQAIQGLWMEVTVKAGPSGLEADDVFYFGNAIGEIGTNAGSARVNVLDELAIRANQTASAAIGSRYDINRDGVVDAADEAAAKAHVTWSGNELRLIAPPVVTAMATPATEPALEPTSAAAPAVTSATAPTSNEPAVALSAGTSATAAAATPETKVPAAMEITARTNTPAWTVKTPANFAFHRRPTATPAKRQPAALTMPVARTAATSGATESTRRHPQLAHGRLAPFGTTDSGR